MASVCSFQRKNDVEQSNEVTPFSDIPMNIIYIYTYSIYTLILSFSNMVCLKMMILQLQMAISIGIMMINKNMGSDKPVS